MTQMGVPGVIPSASPVWACVDATKRTVQNAHMQGMHALEQVLTASRPGCSKRMGIIRYQHTMQGVKWPVGMHA